MTAHQRSTTREPVPVRVERSGHLLWLFINELRVDPQSQRELRHGWAAQIAQDFDPDKFLPLLVSKRDGKFYVIDGQHRVEAMRLMGWNDQQVQCWVYEGLTLAQEADLFLHHNNRKAVTSFDKFRIGVEAERLVECDINRIVLANNLKVSQNKTEGAVSAVGALRRVYQLDPVVLARALRIVRDAYGDDGLHGPVIEGIGLVCARFNGDVDDAHAVNRLATVRGAIGALLSKAQLYHKQLGKPMTTCIAGAAVEIIKSDARGKKLPSWWS